MRGRRHNDVLQVLGVADGFVLSTAFPQTLWTFLSFPSFTVIAMQCSI